jgi:8-oxo-dGTP pyrophosphatase MutT (NUDIX family)
VIETLYSKADIRKALNLPGFDVEAAQNKMIPRPRGTQLPGSSGPTRQGSVLLVLYLLDGQNYLVLTRRRDDLQAHAGQISFPGGQREDGESLEEAAIREAQEEVGIKPGNLSILGHLECLYIPPTDYAVYPFVAWHTGQPQFTAQVEEVAEILEVPLGHLLNPDNQFEELWEIRGFQVQVPYYLVGPHKVWGATAMILSEFLERLRVIDSPQRRGERRED